METTLRKRRNSLLAAAPIIFLAAGSGGLSEKALAQALPADDQARQIQLLRQQMDALTKKLDELSARQTRSSTEAPRPATVSTIPNTSSVSASATATPTSTQTASADDGSDSWGASMPPRLRSLLAALGNMEFYGNLDLSVDYLTKGLKSEYTRSEERRVGKEC